VVTPGERKRLVQIADLLGLAALHLRELADDDERPVESQRRGRPRVEPAAWQIDEVLRLRHSNGRLGLRAIGAKVDLSWRLVERILEQENTASQKGAPASQKPSADSGGSAA
jgi:type II secretory pathway component PulJ